VIIGRQDSPGGFRRLSPCVTQPRVCFRPDQGRLVVPVGSTSWSAGGDRHHGSRDPLRAPVPGRSNPAADRRADPGRVRQFAGCGAPAEVRSPGGRNRSAVPRGGGAEVRAPTRANECDGDRRGCRPRAGASAGAHRDHAGRAPACSADNGDACTGTADTSGGRAVPCAAAAIARNAARTDPTARTGPAACGSRAAPSARGGSAPRRGGSCDQTSRTVHGGGPTEGPAGTTDASATKPPSSAHHAAVENQ
jgi:hypothetical protein